MHELTLAREICRIAAERAGDHPLTEVVAVGVEVGDRSGIEAGSLEFCLGVLLSSPPFGGARAVVAVVPGSDLRLTHLEVENGGPQD